MRVSFDGSAVKAGVIISAGVGAGGSRRLLNDESWARRRSVFACRSADTSRLRFDLRDVFFSSQIKTVDGCDAFALNAGCGQLREGFIGSARNLIVESSSDVLHNVGLYIGAGFTL